MSATTGRESEPTFGIISFRAPSKDNCISFSSKLSLGIRYQGAGQPATPTMDLFEFSGTFKYTDKLSEAAPTEQMSHLRLKPKRILYL